MLFVLSPHSEASLLPRGTDLPPNKSIKINTDIAIVFDIVIVIAIVIVIDIGLRDRLSCRTPKSRQKRLKKAQKSEKREKPEKTRILTPKTRFPTIPPQNRGFSTPETPK